MSKTQRLMELLMAVNRKRKFTVKELAQEFGVSPRTILRDLQELSEWGVPLYSEVGPHGGYQVLRERLLPPIAFTEEEALAIFFAVHALRHYSSLPFAAASSTALRKFYQYLPPDSRERIDQMQQRVDFITPARRAVAPSLASLLDAAIQQQVLRITYQSREKRTSREIQPIGIYARNGLWYCPAYCFESKGIRVFRCDRFQETAASSREPLDLRQVHLENRASWEREDQEVVHVYVELTDAGVEACEAEHWPDPKLHVRPDGSGWLEGNIAKQDIPYFARFFLHLGEEVTVLEPPVLLDAIQERLAELAAKYR